MSDEVREITPPKGYLEDRFDGRPILTSEKGPIVLTNRHLSEVDAYFDSLLTTGINTKIKETHGRRIEILDLGSGTQSLACKELGKVFGEKVRISGIDFYPKDAAETSVVQGDIRELPFKTATFDIIFSTEVLNYLEHSDDEQVVSEISRVLKLGGFALLHWDNIAFLDGRIQPHLRQQAKRLHLIWKSKIVRSEGQMPRLFYVLFKPPLNKDFSEKVDEVG